MSKYAVRNFKYSSTGGYVCYPKVNSNDRTWDGRSQTGTTWMLDVDQHETVDLINNAGFADGDIVFPAIDVVAGDDATCSKVFIVSTNGGTASFECEGTTLNTSLTYNGTN